MDSAYPAAVAPHNHLWLVKHMLMHMASGTCLLGHCWVDTRYMTTIQSVYIVDRLEACKWTRIMPERGLTQVRILQRLQSQIAAVVLSILQGHVNC